MALGTRLLPGWLAESTPHGLGSAPITWPWWWFKRKKTLTDKGFGVTAICR